MELVKTSSTRIVDTGGLKPGTGRRRRVSDRDSPSTPEVDGVGHKWRQEKNELTSHRTGSRPIRV